MLRASSADVRRSLHRDGPPLSVDTGGAEEMAGAPATGFDAVSSSLTPTRVASSSSQQGGF